MIAALVAGLFAAASVTTAAPVPQYGDAPDRPIICIDTESAGRFVGVAPTMRLPNLGAAPRYVQNAYKQGSVWHRSQWFPYGDTLTYQMDNARDFGIWATSVISARGVRSEWQGIEISMYNRPPGVFYCAG